MISAAYNIPYDWEKIMRQNNVTIYRYNEFKEYYKTTLKERRRKKKD